jgi:hypothetical protein
MLLLRYLGPFKVIGVDNSRNNITLELPAHMRCHNVFHISLLREWISPDRDFAGRESPQPIIPACNRDGHDEFEVDRIIDSRVHGRWKKRQFLVRWKNTDECENS